jgi:hypothetical protein
MQAQSRAQQRAANVALTAKRGGLDPHELKGPARALYETMTMRQLEEMASTPVEDLPEEAKGH